MLRLTLCLVAFATPSLLAQEVSLQIEKAKQPTRYTIETRSEVETQREILMDGEPMQGRGGGGRAGGMGGGPTKIEMKLVFDEGRDKSGATWRLYHGAAAAVTRTGREGEPTTTEIEGGLIGQKLLVFEDDRGVVVRPYDADEGEEVPPQLSRGLPVAVSFAGMLPKEPVAVGEEFKFGKSLQKTFVGLNHPVRSAPDPDAAGGGRGGGQRGQRGGFRRAPSANDTALAMLAAAGLEAKATGTLVSVEDGVAKVTFEGTLMGDGDAAALGMGRGGFGGRGMGGQRGGQRGGQQPQASAKAKVAIHVAGELWIDTQAHALKKLVLEGKLQGDSHQETDRGDRGLMEIDQKSKGAFRVAVTTEPSPKGSDDGAK